MQTCYVTLTRMTFGACLFGTYNNPIITYCEYYYIYITIKQKKIPIKEKHQNNPYFGICQEYMHDFTEKSPKTP